MARIVALCTVFAIALSIAGCGGGSDPAPNQAPSVPVVSTTSTETYQSGPPPTYDFNFIWEASTDPEGDPVEYYAELYQNVGVLSFPFDFNTDGVLYASSGWITALNWQVIGAPNLSLYVLRVKARDPTSESDWGVYENDQLGSCPFVFSWDGEQYVFESDVFPGGRLGTIGYQTFLRPYPIDYYVMTSTPALKDGAYEIQLTAERDEVDYVDEVQLLALYHPDTTTIFAERAPLGVATFPGIERLHTVRLPLQPPVSITHVNTGEDVTDAVGAMDGTYITLNDDPNVGYVYQTLELQLGDLTGAAQIKLIIDGQCVYPTTVEGAARLAEFGQATRIEVRSVAGTWVEVPLDVVEMPNLTGFRRVIVLDMTDAFPTTDYRVRLTWLFKSFVDAILLDTSLDEPITAVPLPLLSADLHYRGFSGRTPGEKYELVYDQVSSWLPKYFPGAYTRFGDVRELLTDADDRFVITFGGDEITLRFGPAAAPGAGQLLGFALMANGYYKDEKIELPITVEPLPFGAMSNYPYDPAVEHYPDDAVHNEYRETWNTRVHPAPEDER